VVQTPQAYRSATLDRVALPDADAAPALAAAGIGVHTVTGDPSAFALRTGDDVDLARAVVRG
jgi:2-C-methyl-D-erythritol 4-phosphate cytidylyltransferase